MLSQKHHTQRRYRIWLSLASLLALLALALPLLPTSSRAHPAHPTRQNDQPDKAVVPPAGPPGTTFAFYAFGLGARSDVVYWATAPDGVVYGEDTYRVRSNDEGRADWQWIAPPNALPGTWTMVARRLTREDVFQTITFEIVPASEGDPVPPPEVDAPNTNTRNVSPAVGAPGSRFTFFATGFQRRERVGFWFNAPNGRIYSDAEVYATRAAEDGRADWEWIAPLDAPVGVWQVVAEGIESGTTRSISFEIRPPEEDPAGGPQTGVEPAVAEPEQQIAFFATGFDPREKVSYWTIKPDGDTRQQDRYVRANDEGRADWFWSAPRRAQFGTWQMVARGDVTGVTRVIAFEIVPPGSAP